MRWVKIYDSILNWRWHHKPEYVSFMLHCLLKANPKPTKWETIELGKGQFVTSMKSMCETIGISERTYRTIIKNLTNCGFLTVKTTNKYTIVTVCNFATYQATKEDKRQSNDNQTPYDSQSNDNQTTTDIDIKDNRIKDFFKNTHTEIFQKFLEVCKKDTKQAERLTSEFVKYNANKPDTWWNGGLWKNHIQGFFRKDLKLNAQQTQSPQVAPAPPKVQKQAPQAPDPEAVKVWENVKKRLSELMNAKAIKVWINPITAFAVNGKELTIGVPSQFFYEYLEKNYLPQLKTALSEEKIEILQYRIIA